MDASTALLEQLRDVQQPLPPEGVPMWLVVANVLIVLVIAALVLYRRHDSKYYWRKQLIKDLRLARKQPASEALVSAATILRQLLLFRGHAVQRLSGEPWLQKLDKVFTTQWFTQGAGRVFGNSLYQRSTENELPIDLLFSELENLIDGLPARQNDKSDST